LRISRHLQDLPCSPTLMYFNTPAPDSLRQVLDLTQSTQFRFDVYEKSGLTLF